MEIEKQNIFKDVMSRYPTGVTVITTTDDNDKPVGLTVNSFVSLSLEPLLVLWCIDHRSSSIDAFKNANGFAVHILSADQKDVCWIFADKDEDRFSKVNWSLSNLNLPIISGTLGVLQCKTIQQIDAGDHTIVIGEVLDLEQFDKEPMLYFRRQVGSIPLEWSN